MLTPDLGTAPWVKSSRSTNNGGCVEIAAGTAWRKSNHSANNGACVEIAGSVTWRKSSHSANNGMCVEVVDGGRWAAIRDSKNPDGPALVLTPAQLAAFVRSVQAAR
ncbi:MULTISPECIES: DUF397 domain-containing protein [Actinoalloteichus]|uniref:DUF397 family protein n=1 Tax=Actinoalloteichus fjordicus TaxID=1612552 RepID=A0AAC9LCT2_9PSEU|nr:MULTISPECIES: DUF397 domain-containing protein [Actinoalloteichus]APU14475.1 putative DUF397 family protein [Actinoalloteichus fjordicus]APU20444.1 putative DUF397 family protein [Actinoalloteichus sp. GBA129-24]